MYDKEGVSARMNQTKGNNMTTDEENGTRTEEQKKELLNTAKMTIAKWKRRRTQLYKDGVAVQNEINATLNQACDNGERVDDEYTDKVLSDVRKKYKF